MGTFIFLVSYWSENDKRSYAVRAFKKRNEANSYCKYCNADWDGLGRKYYYDTIPLD